MNTLYLSSATPPAWLHPRERWITVKDAAMVWGYNERTIRRWCQDGTFASYGIQVHFDGTAARHGQWWILLPPELYHSESQIQRTQVVDN